MCPGLSRSGSPSLTDEVLSVFTTKNLCQLVGQLGRDCWLVTAGTTYPLMMAQLCWELHLVWYKATACWQCGWLRVKAGWVNSILSNEKSAELKPGQPSGEVLTGWLGSEGLDSLSPQ